MNTSIYQNIATRTAGDIYIGVVGPVRTGKSTLIKRIMEQMVIPCIDDPYRKERARDELPQSGSGRTIMTAEPKFVPEEAVEISPDISSESEYHEKVEEPDATSTKDTRAMAAAVNIILEFIPFTTYRIRGSSGPCTR